MTSPTKPTPPAIGFLTIAEPTEFGAVGGYLVLNAGGRPLEFHCTAPVKANRSQEILYGATLKSYLYGEQIGQALVTRAKTPVLMVLTDLVDVLTLRAQLEIPVALIAANSDALPTTSSGFAKFSLGTLAAAVATLFQHDEHVIVEAISKHAPSLDLVEPFARIREALEEAQKTSRAA